MVVGRCVTEENPKFYLDLDFVKMKVVMISEYNPKQSLNPTLTLKIAN